MKKPFILLLVTVALSVSASANNLDQGGELTQSKSPSYSFSINDAFLSLFTLFCVEEEKTDSIVTPVKRELELSKPLED